MSYDDSRSSTIFIKRKEKEKVFIYLLVHDWKYLENTLENSRALECCEFGFWNNLIKQQIIIPFPALTYLSDQDIVYFFFFKEVNQSQNIKYLLRLYILVSINSLASPLTVSL